MGTSFHPRFPVDGHVVSPTPHHRMALIHIIEMLTDAQTKKIRRKSQLKIVLLSVVRIGRTRCRIRNLDDSVSLGTFGKSGPRRKGTLPLEAAGMDCTTAIPYVPLHRDFASQKSKLPKS